MQTPPLLILMATLNGARFLPGQLASIARQTHRNWRLLVSDDGSRDGTRAILAHFRAAHPAGQIEIVSGPGTRERGRGAGGAAANFLSLLQRADLRGASLAFCDQDDVWDSDHLSRALAALGGANTPLALYGCRMRICDADLRPRALSPLPRRPLVFRNALLQNVLSGNTMVATPAAARLLQEAADEATGAGGVPVHDWWAYQLVTGAGGHALYDAHPAVAYRQHGANAVGAAPGPLRRALRHLRGEPRSWAARNIAALRASSARLTPESRCALARLARALETPLPLRITAMRRAGVYHQSPQARVAFWASVALGRF